MRVATLVVLLAAAGSVAAAGRGFPERSLAADGCTTLPLGYNVLMRTGESAGTNEDVLLGGLIDTNGNPVSEDDGTRAVSTQPDFSSILTAADGSLWMVTQFESPQPALVQLIGLEQDKATGTLTPTSLTNVDFSEQGGIWTTCAGSVSPWGTHLGGEEYEPDARLLAEATSLMGDEETSFKSIDEDNAMAIADYLRFYGLYNESTTMDEIRAVFNAYKFGYAFEVAPSGDGNYTASKLYTLARNSKELVYVMPDNKTVYITDDGTQVALFKFVADMAGDLSSGTLYGAKATQTDAENGGSFDITWIELGSHSQGDVEDMIESVAFSDIFDTATPENGTCPDGFIGVNAAGLYLLECLKLKEGMEKAAAALESRRYLGYLGGTTEFSKWEGFTFSPKRREVYTAMSEVRYGMEDNAKKGEADDSYDAGTSNDVRVAYNKCGCVYILGVDEEYSVTNMTALVCGYPNPDTTDEANACALDGIGAPDNIAVADEHDILIIGEDAGDQHQNDMVWAYNLNTGNMTRMLTTVYGAESTSPYWYPNIGGFSYITAVVQHPYIETDEDKLTNPFSEGAAGYLGYFVMPASQTADKSLVFAEVPVPMDDESRSKNVGSPSVDVCPQEASGPTVVTPEQA